MLCFYNSETNIIKMKCTRCGANIEFTYPSLDAPPRTIDVACGECLHILKDVEVLPESEYGNYTDILPRKTPDMVNHPPHYQSETGLETIDVIEAFTFDLKGIEAFCTGNALKYLCRWKNKDGLKDLKKAGWYINRLIKHIEKLEKENDQS